MAKAKYKLYFQKMIDAHPEEFRKFQDLHSKYSLDEHKYQEEFNSFGTKIRDLIHEWEDRLCKNTESGGYSKYSANLAEKFQNEVRTHFPLIDRVGIITESAPQFSIKKITPN